MEDQVKSNLLSSQHWIRLVFMLLFAGLLQVAMMVLWCVVILQFIFSLLTGTNNARLRSFGYSLSTFMYQSFKFLTYHSDDKPYPFSDWPTASEEDIES